MTKGCGRVRRAALAGLTVFAVLLQACGGQAAPLAASSVAGATSQADWDKIVVGARREGKVRVITNPAHRSFIQQIAPNL